MHGEDVVILFRNIKKSGIALLLAVLVVVSFAFSGCGTAQESSLPEVSSESEVSTPEESSGSSESEGSTPEESSGSSESEVSTPEESSGGSESEPSEPEKDYAAQNIFVYDLAGGLLYSKGEMEAELFPASITKLAAALTALEVADPQMVCTVGDELKLVAADASIAYVRKGHELTVEMLIEAMLLPSGCDAAYVLAANVGRLLEPNAADAGQAVDAFIAEMNEWSERNGFVNTVWENPDGYHAEGHYSCLADILKLGELSLESEIVMKYASTAYAKVTYASGHINEWSNTNQLLQSASEHYNPYCVGLKTGTTGRAGACLLAAFEKDGKKSIVGVFGCENSYDRFAVTNELYEDFLK